MKLFTNDKCYKFFYSKVEPASVFGSGANRICYMAGQTYSSEQGLFFFRQDEAIASLKDFIYFMGHGDSLAEIVVDQNLVDCALSTSPNHFSATTIKISNTYDSKSEEMRDLVLAVLRNCEDFSTVRFCDAIIRLIEMGAFDTALFVCETICAERGIVLSDLDHRQIIELSYKPWLTKVPFELVTRCRHIREYIGLISSTK